MRRVMQRRSLVTLSVLTALAGTTPLATADEWSAGPSLNQARQNFASVVDSCGTLWVLGGRYRSGDTWVTLDSIEILPIDGESYADAWEVAPTVMPEARQLASAVEIGGFIYIIGGQNAAHEIVASVLRYDTLTNSWSTSAVPPLNTARYGAACIVDRLGRIWVVGGTNEAYPIGLTSTEIYDPMRPALGWQDGPALNEGRWYCGGVVDHNGLIYAIGGGSMSDHLRTVERIDPCDPNGSWEVLPELLPSPASNEVEAVVGADGFIYATGGWFGGFGAQVYRCDPANGAWEPWVSLTLARDNHRAVLGNDQNIYVIGGETAIHVASTSVETMYTGQCNGDLNADRSVDLADLSELLAYYGYTCP